MASLADKLGRTRALYLSILLYSVFTFACGFAQNVWQFAIFRIFLGLGMGGEWASGATLVSETWPEKHRGKALGIMQSCWAIGYGLAAVVVAIVLPRFGWRAVFFVGIIPAIFTLWIRRKREGAGNVDCLSIRRSARSDNVRLRARQADRFPLATRDPADPHERSDHVRLVGVEPVGSVLPFAADRTGGVGLSTETMAFFVVAMQVGMWFGYVTFGFISDAFGRKPTYVTYLVVAAILVWLYGATRNPMVLLVLGPFVAFFGNGILQRLRRRRSGNLSDLDPRNRAWRHLQQRPATERRRAIRDRLPRAIARLRRRVHADVGRIPGRRGVMDWNSRNSWEEDDLETELETSQLNCQLSTVNCQLTASLSRPLSGRSCVRRSSRDTAPDRRARSPPAHSPRPASSAPGRSSP